MDFIINKLCYIVVNSISSRWIYAWDNKQSANGLLIKFHLEPQEDKMPFLYGVIYMYMQSAMTFCQMTILT
jgi:hypothetical protein